MRARTAMVALWTPVLILLAVWAVMVARSTSSAHPIWDISPINLSEAAAYRDAGAVLRRLWAGEDPSAPGVVRAGVLDGGDRAMTPLEAAARARRDELVLLLLQFGARPDRAAWLPLWCLTDDTEVRRRLIDLRPAGASDRCDALDAGEGR